MPAPDTETVWLTGLPLGRMVLDEGTGRYSFTPCRDGLGQLRTMTWPDPEAARHAIHSAARAAGIAGPGR